ncbi:DELLA protein RGA [Forsythia ovata]|uniref:DELLA protein RGA n=1 Tax=Forsythia ovata TaxID=205694 RepID=A0ABD1RQP0_9LAMI
MAEVAQKLEQLEEVMGSVQQDGLSQIASKTVHYNPSDLSSWLESMISELNPVPNFDSFNSIVQDRFLESSTVTSIDSHSHNSLNSHGRAQISVSTQQQMVVDSDFGSDLISIPGKAMYPTSQQHPPPQSAQHQPQAKKMKPSSYSGMGVSWGLPNESVSAQPIEPAHPVLLVDSQENGIRLVHALMACAEAVQQENLKLAEALVKQMRPTTEIKAHNKAARTTTKSMWNVGENSLMKMGILTYVSSISNINLEILFVEFANQFANEGFHD